MFHMYEMMKNYKLTFFQIAPYKRYLLSSILVLEVHLERKLVNKAGYTAIQSRTVGEEQ